MTRSRWTTAALLSGTLTTGMAGPSGQEPATGTPSPDAVQPGLASPETPIADSIEPVVERYIREHYVPCGATGNAVPCFPVTLQVKGRQYSVRETLDSLQLDNRPAPGAPPTAAEMIQHGANPHPTSAGVGFDPKAVVCKTKQLLRRIQGTSRTYYLYRVWDETGERAILRDRPLDPNVLAGSPRFRYVPLGEFEDECAAVKAYLATTHDVRLRREAGKAGSSEEPAVELPSGDDPE